MNIPRRVIGGIDPSASGLGLVAVPEDWGCDFGRVKRRTLRRVVPQLVPDKFAGTEWAKCQGLDQLALDVCEWLTWARVTHLAIERVPSYATGKFSLDPVREVAFVVRHTIGTQSLLPFPQWVEISKARKLICGKLPQRQPKQVVASIVKSMTSRFGDGDQIDAFVCANWLMCEMGLPAIVAPEVEGGLKEKKR